PSVAAHETSRDERMGQVQRLTALEGLEASKLAGRCNAIAAMLVDATLDADHSALDLAMRRLQRERAALSGAEARGRVLCRLDLARWGIGRAVPAPLHDELLASGRARALLAAIDDDNDRSSRDLADVLGVDEAEVSRQGKRLLEAGLVTRRRAGREIRWETTPKGDDALVALHGPSLSAVGRRDARGAQGERLATLSGRGASRLGGRRNAAAAT